MNFLNVLGWDSMGSRCLQERDSSPFSNVDIARPSSSLADRRRLVGLPLFVLSPTSQKSAQLRKHALFGDHCRLLKQTLRIKYKITTRTSMLPMDIKM